MQPAHGLPPLQAQQPPAEGRRPRRRSGRRRPDRVDRRPHRGHAEDRRLLPALLGRAHRDRCSSRSRASTPSSCSTPGSPPASDRTTSVSTAARAAARGSCSSSASVRACCSCSRTSRSDRAAPNPLERKSVEDSFAKSILWGFTVAAESGGHVLVDATDFLLRDVTGAGSALRPGTYRVDRTRSVFYLPRTKAFPKNTEIEMTLTFANDAAGGRGGGGGGPAQGPPADRRRRAAGRRRWRARRRPLLRVGRERHADGRSRDDARARVARRTAGQQLQAALRRSARRLRRPHLRRLQRADRRADAACVSSAAIGSRRRIRPRR